MTVTDVEEHLISSNVCVVAFASGGGDFSGDFPHFEFGRLLHSLDVAHVLLRDSTNFSYQFGITGIGDRRQVCLYIQKLKFQFPKVVLIGLSVGAMGALLYGQLTLTEVIALSPFTSLGNNPDAVFGPDWRAKVQDLEQFPPFVDLSPLYAGGPNMRVRAFISDGEGTDQDRWMAERIGIQDITLIPGASHSGLGALMRDAGLLRGLILE